jgi:hypothetical protein
MNTDTDVTTIITRAAGDMTHAPVLKDYGVPLTRARYERTLRAHQQRLARVLRDIPREAREGLTHYCARVFDGSPQGVDRSTVLHAAVVAHCNLGRMDAEDAAEQNRRNADMTHDAPLSAMISVGALQRIPRRSRSWSRRLKLLATPRRRIGSPLSRCTIARRKRAADWRASSVASKLHERYCERTVRR